MANGVTEPGVPVKIVDAVKVVGFPIVMCLVFIAWEAGWLPSQSRDTIRLLRDHEQSTKDVVGAINELRNTTRATVLLTTCLTYARSVEIQQECVKRYQQQ